MDFREAAMEAGRHRADTAAKLRREKEDLARAANRAQKDRYGKLVHLAEGSVAKWMRSVQLEPAGIQLEVAHIRMPERIRVDGYPDASTGPVVTLGWRAVEHDFLADTWFTGMGEPRQGGVDMLTVSGDGQPVWKRAMDLASIGAALLLEAELERRPSVAEYIGTIFEP